MRVLIVPVVVLHALLAPLVAAHGGPVTIHYVGGTASDVGVASVGGGCSQTYVSPFYHVGGACGIEVHGGHDVRIDVVDDHLGPLPFTWKALNAQNGICAEGSGVASGVFTLPAPCESLSVYAPLGATTGDVTITPLSA